METNVRDMRSSTIYSQDGVVPPANTTSAYFNRSLIQSPVNITQKPPGSTGHATAQHSASPGPVGHATAQHSASPGLAGHATAKHSASPVASPAAAKHSTSTVTAQTYSPMGPTLTPIKFNLSDQSPTTITEYLVKLNANMEMMNTSISALRTDMNAANINQDEKFSHLEKRMESKYDELSKKLDTKFENFDSSLHTTQGTVDSNKQEIDSLRAMILDQQQQITEMMQTADADRSTNKFEI
jgi:hypothetical protein